VKEWDSNELTEIIEGANAVDEALKSLCSGAKLEVCSFITGYDKSGERFRQARTRNTDLFARGVRSRSIYLAEARNQEATSKHVKWMNEQGAEVRTLPDLPMQMSIYDAKVAILPFRAKHGKHALVIHREPSIVYLLQSFFNLNWTAASPLGVTFDLDGSPISTEDRALLEMLSLGRIDKEICADMDLSPRTIASRIAILMTRLNAKTRFAAGVQAAKRNWI
jgi:DNA-binding CsgD family transcriptional regulator